MTPPPIRRIVVDRKATVASPSAQPAAANGRSSGPGPFTSLPQARPATPLAAVERMRLDGLGVAYSGIPAVQDVTLPVRKGEVLALIGPSGCGKTTLLRSLNRLTELTPEASRSGRIVLDGEDVDRLDVAKLRRRVSMVFQQPNPFPMSIFDNVAYALREQASRRPRRAELREPVEEALRRAGLWDEVAEDLGRPALRLSGGQQQRLCIARALAAKPEVLLLDEPCSALDPKSTATIEELIVRLGESLAVVIVTHNLQQAWRVANQVAFMYLGELVEYGPAEQVFSTPRARRTRDYVQGAFG
jgi:phosphate transport system ATP-binding protein